MAALATTVIGALFAVEAQLVALVAVLTLMLAAERRWQAGDVAGLADAGG